MKQLRERCIGVETSKSYSSTTASIPCMDDTTTVKKNVFACPNERMELVFVMKYLNQWPFSNFITSIGEVSTATCELIHISPGNEQMTNAYDTSEWGERITGLVLMIPILYTDYSARLKVKPQTHMKAPDNTPRDPIIFSESYLKVGDVVVMDSRLQSWFTPNINFVVGSTSDAWFLKIQIHYKI
ncbi:MAG: hypothetical protein ACTSUE_15990 [Promethearchaeota archaeon]